MISDGTVSIKEEDGVVQVHLNRPEQGNRIDTGTADVLRALWRKLRRVNTRHHRCGLRVDSAGTSSIRSSPPASSIQAG